MDKILKIRIMVTNISNLLNSHCKITLNKPRTPLFMLDPHTHLEKNSGSGHGEIALSFPLCFVHLIV